MGQHFRKTVHNLFFKVAPSVNMFFFTLLRIVFQNGRQGSTFFNIFLKNMFSKLLPMRNVFSIFFNMTSNGQHFYDIFVNKSKLIYKWPSESTFSKLFIKTLLQLAARCYFLTCLIFYSNEPPSYYFAHN